MGKLRDIKGYVKVILKKLRGIKVHLVRLDGNWNEWDFSKLVKILRKWADRNLKVIHNSSDKGQKHENLSQKMIPKPVSVYFIKYLGIDQRMLILSKNYALIVLGKMQGVLSLVVAKCFLIAKVNIAH